MPLLLEMTCDHCAYCDGFPMGVMTTRTIDHFQPKETYPEKSFSWENLYPCCNACQDAKGAEYHVDLLRPHDPDYDFARYFLFNYRTGEIEVNRLVSKQAQSRAENTLALLNLNDRESDLPEDRLLAYEDHEGNPGRPTAKRPYRFMFSI